MHSFRRDQSGGIILAVALGLPVLIGGAGVAVDLSVWQNERMRAQSAADSAALSVVKELAVAGSDSKRLTAVATSAAQVNLGDLADRSRVSASLPDGARGKLKVDIELQSAARLSRILGLTDASIAVSATARVIGSMKLCMLALDPNKGKTIQVSKSAKVTAPNCAVFVNSNDKQALSSKDSAQLRAQTICTAGGYEGSAGNFSPVPKTDCPKIPDPLAGRKGPTVGSHCDHNDLKVEGPTATLKPGIYCKGLKITKDAKVKLEPGIYIIKDGKLIVDNRASIEGVNVGFYLTGNGSALELDKDTTVSLTAPRDGAMAGLLFFEDQKVSPGSKHAILSNNAHTLLGTIYLPQGYLHVDAERPISQKAAYTIVVASRVEMISGPELFLNADYGASDVPVPGGLGPVAGYPVLDR